MSDCAPCDKAATEAAQRQLEQIIKHATDWAKRNGKTEMAIIMGKNCPAFCATDDPRIAERTVIQYISVL